MIQFYSKCIQINKWKSEWNKTKTRTVTLANTNNSSQNSILWNSPKLSPWRDTETGATAISLSEDHGIYTCSNAAIGTQTRRWSCRSSPRRHHHRTSPVITPAQDAALAFDMDSQQTGIWRRAALSLQRLRGDSWPRFKPRRRARVCAWLPSVADGLL